MHGFLSNLLRNAKANQAARYDKRGFNPPVFTLTMDHLREIYKTQHMIGFYSHIPLNLPPLSHWQASIERLDPPRDYVQDNIALEALELNGRCQWTLQKIAQIPSLIYAPTNITAHDLNHAKFENKQKQKPQRKAMFQNNSYYCYDCEVWIPIEDVYSSQLTLCKSCYQRNRNRYASTVRG
eukprot:299288_1